jgi:hypothetical protein
MHPATETLDPNALHGPSRDLARRPATVVLWWVLPYVLATATDFLRLTQQDAAWIWAAAMAWMSVGCFLNAWRCHRLHCYISGPALALGALAAALIGADLIDLGPHGLSHVTWVALGLAVLSFVPEFRWGRYV